MGYTAGVPGDEQAHARHHAAALRAIPFPVCCGYPSDSAVQCSAVCVWISQGLSIGRALQGWKNENVVREHEDGSRVICVTRRDEPRHIKKACRLGHMPMCARWRHVLSVPSVHPAGGPDPGRRRPGAGVCLGGGRDPPRHIQGVLRGSAHTAPGLG
jgi:hypothetical protein